MPIKSLEELRSIREESKRKVGLRHGEDWDGQEAEILVGMATCGIAAGARETLNALVSELSSHDIPNVRVVPVGCIGYCKLEPLIVVMRPGEKPVAYGNVAARKAKEIVERHLIGGKPVQSLIVEVELGGNYGTDKM